MLCHDITVPYTDHTVLPIDNHPRQRLNGGESLRGLSRTLGAVSCASARRNQSPSYLRSFARCPGSISRHLPFDPVGHTIPLSAHSRPYSSLAPLRNAFLFCVEPPLVLFESLFCYSALFAAIRVIPNYLIYSPTGTRLPVQQYKEMAPTMKKEKVAIIGSGLIGRSWAMLFASVGYQVTIYDIVPDIVAKALAETKKELNKLEKDGLIRGTLTAAEQFGCIKGTDNLKEAISGALYVQECVPERLDMKKTLYTEVDGIVGPNTILASSTSTFMPSLFSEELKHRSQVLVAHPVNPPYYVPLVEIVPAPWTNPAFVTKARELMTEIGQKPVTLSRQIEGFALNRIQYAILNETWRLVADGILSVKDIDVVMSEGLGMRYAFLGPLETAHLNAEGMLNYCERYSKTIYAVSQTMGPTPHMEGKVAEQVAKELEEMVAIEQLPERRAWRDACLTKLAQLKKDI